MRRILRATVGVLSACAPSLAPAVEGQRVHRCLGLHGEVVFSGLPCGAETAAAGTGTTTPEPASTATAVCPASLDQLRERIAGAIARKDANALAGLLRWNGVRGAEAASRLRELDRIAQRPLLAIEAGSVDADAAEPTDRAQALRVRTGSSDSGGVREHRFGLHVDAGCHWLTW